MIKYEKYRIYLHVMHLIKCKQILTYIKINAGPRVGNSWSRTVQQCCKCCYVCSDVLPKSLQDRDRDRDRDMDTDAHTRAYTTCNVMSFVLWNSKRFNNVVFWIMIACSLVGCWQQLRSEDIFCFVFLCYETLCFSGCKVCSSRYITASQLERPQIQALLPGMVHI
jgi:hypothetical protein